MPRAVCPLHSLLEEKKRVRRGRLAAPVKGPPKFRSALRRAALLGEAQAAEAPASVGALECFSTLPRV